MPHDYDSDADEPNAYEDDLPLAQLMHALASQLQKAREWAARAAFSGQPSPIAWTDAQIEVGVTWTRGGNGELDLKVVHLGGNRTKENTATMTVSLAPASGQPEITVSRPKPMLLQLPLRLQGRAFGTPGRIVRPARRASPKDAKYRKRVRVARMTTSARASAGNGRGWSAPGGVG